MHIRIVPLHVKPDSICQRLRRICILELGVFAIEGEEVIG